MKRSKPCLPRKMKKAMGGLLISDEGQVFFNGWFLRRHYPRTKWVVRAERQFRRLWTKNNAKDSKISMLERTIGILNAETETL